MVMAIDQNRCFERQPLSGIDVLVAGAGLGGLMAAVELFRQGHNVRMIEAKYKMEGLGRHTSSCDEKQGLSGIRR